MKNLSFLILLAFLFSGCSDVLKKQTEPDVRIHPVEKSPLTLFQGGVVTAHPAATEAALNILRKGGNAFDAMVTAISVLNIVEPHASGMGGGGFLVAKSKAEKNPWSINFRESAPASLDANMYYENEESKKHLQTGSESVLVPGTPAMLDFIHKNYCSLSRYELLEPAINLATNGYPADSHLVELIQWRLDDLYENEPASLVFLRDGFPPEPGTLITNPNLAKLFTHLAENEFSAFYQPQITNSLLAAVEGKSFLQQQDFSGYIAYKTTPLTFSFQKWKFYMAPPPSGGGFMLAEILNSMEYLPSYSSDPAQYNHNLVEMQKLCMSDVYLSVNSDSRLTDLQKLLNSDRPDIFARKINRDSAQEYYEPEIKEDHGNTTHLVIADKIGNYISVTLSLNNYFGAAIMDADWGVLLNNTMKDYDSDAEGINALRPHSQPRSNMCPLIATGPDEEILLMGTPGGARIPTTMAQVLSYFLVQKKSLPESISGARYFPAGLNIYMEGDFSPETAAYLQSKGNIINMVPANHSYFGGVSAALIKNGIFTGAADNRRSGFAGGY